MIREHSKRVRSRTRPLGAAILLTITVSFVAVACLPDHDSVEFVVDTYADGPDAIIGDGVCEMTEGLGDCSLRAAIDEGNAAARHPVVTVPQGAYSLSALGADHDDDANALGDLDVAPVSGSMIILAELPGAAIDARYIDTAIDVRSGILVAFGIATTRANVAGITTRAGADLTLGFAASHHNLGAGALVEAGATTHVLHSTLSDNGTAGVSGAGAVVGRFATITANQGGGIIGATKATLDASVVADQVLGPDCAGPAEVVSLGNNLDSDGTCASGGTRDINGAHAMLGALTSDVVPVHPPLPESPVLDAVPAGAAPCEASPSLRDQQGRWMPIGAGCNRGADEEDPFVPTTALALTVTSAADGPDMLPRDGVCATSDGVCTLRAAIGELNQWPSPDDSVTIAPGVDPVLSVGGVHEDADMTGDLDVLGTLAIHGGGATIDGSRLDRVIDHRAGALSIDHVTITGGLQEAAHEWWPGNGGDGNGGGISSVGALTVTDSTVTGNYLAYFAAAGGGIFAQGGPVLIERTTIVGNGLSQVGEGDGGGVSITDVADLRVVDSTISGNHVGGDDHSVDVYGGGIGITRSTGRIDRSTIASNFAAGADGPGLGVGIAARDSDLTLTRSTLSGNDGGTDYFPVNELFALGGSTSIVSSTIVDPFPQIGIAATNATIMASIVTVRCGPAFGGLSVVSGGWNLIGGASAGDGCSFTQPSDLVGVAPQLGALAENGGPTATHLPEATSPAIDRIPLGTNGVCDSSVTIDQRGQPVPAGPACDVGAVEVQAVEVPA